MNPFFKQEHFDTFKSENVTSESEEVNSQRVAVADKLLHLDTILWPQIEFRNNTLGWDLNRHWQSNHHTSTTHIIPNMVEEIRSIWLHYGKSKENIKEFDEYAFYCHTRIQVYVGNHPQVGDCVRVWLISTDKDYYDRRRFLERMAKKQPDRDHFYSLIKSLVGKGYIYEIGDDQLSLDLDPTQAELEDFLKKNKRGAAKVYSGIFRQYLPTDPRLEEDHIDVELWEGIQDLYPVYKFMIAEE